MSSLTWWLACVCMLNKVKPLGLTMFPTRTRKKKLLFTGQINSSNSQNNTDYQCSPWLPLRGRVPSTKTEEEPPKERETLHVTRSHPSLNSSAANFRLLQDLTLPNFKTDQCTNKAPQRMILDKRKCLLISSRERRREMAHSDTHAQAVGDKRTHSNTVSHQIQASRPGKQAQWRPRDMFRQT